MRVFTKVSPRLWSSLTFRGISDDARFAFVYFLTCSHQNSAGCFSLPDGYAVTDLAWRLRRYISARASLIDANLIKFDASTSEILIVKWFRHNPPMNPSHAKSIAGGIERIASKALQEFAQSELNGAYALSTERQSWRGSREKTDAGELLSSQRLRTRSP